MSNAIETVAKTISDEIRRGHAAARKGCPVESKICAPVLSTSPMLIRHIRGAKFVWMPAGEIASGFAIPPTLPTL